MWELIRSTGLRAQIIGPQLIEADFKTLQRTEICYLLLSNESARPHA